MPFEKVETQVDFPARERAVLEFWERSARLLHQLAARSLELRHALNAADFHDTADRINYAKMAKILRLAYLTGFEFANEAVAPKFVENPTGR